MRYGGKAAARARGGYSARMCPAAVPVGTLIAVVNIEWDLGEVEVLRPAAIRFAKPCAELVAVNRAWAGPLGGVNSQQARHDVWVLDAMTVLDGGRVLASWR